jgi:putative oxidoreductase
MNRVASALAAQSSLGYALLRLMAGIVLFYHGYQKVFVMGLGTVAGFFEKIGIFLPQITGPFIGLLELIGGALLFLGLFTRYVAALFAIEFIVASYAAWVLMDRGYGKSELELLILFAGILFATNGAGKYSLDAVFRRSDA